MIKTLMTSLIMVAVACLAQPLQAATATLTVATPEESALPTVVATPEDSALPTAQFDRSVVSISRDQDEKPPLDSFTLEVDKHLTLGIVAGTDFYFYFQYRVADVPEPFEPGRWPRAEFRTAKSPRGVVLATYTVTIEDEANSIWAIRLSAAETALLAGKNGITEQSYADANGQYVVLDWIKTTVRPLVTQ